MCAIPHPFGPPYFSEAVWKLPCTLPSSMSSVSLSVSLLCCLIAFPRAVEGCSASLQVPPRKCGVPDPPRCNLQPMGSGAQGALTFSGLILRQTIYGSSDILQQHGVPIAHVSNQLINTSLLPLVLSRSYLAHFVIFDHWNQLLIKLYLNPSFCLPFGEFKLRHMVK